jgi:hypothetical protein
MVDIYSMMSKPPNIDGKSPKEHKKFKTYKISINITRLMTIF